MTEQESIFADGNISDMEYHRGTVQPVLLACAEETKMEGVCCKRSGCVMDKTTTRTIITITEPTRRLCEFLGMLAGAC